MKFTKIVNPGSVPVGNRKRPMFCKIEIEDGKLSISGVIGPQTSGNADGGEGEESCWGFYGLKYCKEEATAAARSMAERIR